MKCRKSIKAAALVLLLSGCTTSAPVWTRQGATEKDFYMETGQCTVQARSAGAGAAWNTDTELTRIFQACMRGKGWYFTETAWSAGSGSADFSRDDDICSQRTHRGPAWLECMQRAGWTRK